MFKRLFALLLPLTMSATEFNPFVETQLVIDARADYLYQHFTQVQRNHCRQNYSSDDNFLHLSGSGAFDVYMAELEVTGAATRHRTFGFDCASLTGRYRILTDYLDDNTQNFVVGVTATQAVKQSVQDLGSFHHGKIAGVLSAAFGQEEYADKYWINHYWGMIGLGSADVGSPWLQGILAWDHNWWNEHQFRIFVKGLYGFGNNQINVHHFKGYGSIAHRSLDLGFRYDRTFYWNGTWGVEYAFRVYARNFPCNAGLAQIHFEIPLGLGI